MRRLSANAIVPATLALLLFSSGLAQTRVDVEVGIGGHAVTSAWNRLRVVARDVPLSSRFEISFDLGTLRGGEEPLHVVLPLSGGPGLSVAERDLFLAPFRSAAWALLGPEGIVASGSVAGRQTSATPLDVVLGTRGGAYASAFGENGRVVDVSSAALPLSPAAYDGVRSLIVDGSAAPPRLEALAAAVAAGVVLVVHGDLPASHSDVTLLVGSQPRHIGAGMSVLVRGTHGDVAATVAALAADAVDRVALLESLTRLPLVDPPRPLGQQLVVAFALAYAAGAVFATRAFAAPGLLAALVAATLLSIAGWRASRPTEAEVAATRRFVVAGGELGLATSIEEVFTLPAATVERAGDVRLLTAARHSIGPDSIAVDLPAWRSVVLVSAPEVVESPLSVSGTEVRNVGRVVLDDVTVIGAGPQGALSPGAGLTVRSREDGPPPPAYASIQHVLPLGTVLALSGCDPDCTVWIAPSVIAMGSIDDSGSGL